VRDPAGQAADGLHSLRVVHGVARFLELLAPLLLFGDVARDLGVAHEDAAVVVDRVDDHAAPEGAAVLADAPPFGLEATLQPRRFQRAPRHPGISVFGCVKNGEMLTDDLVRAVALEPFSARIPAAYPTFGVEEIDGVVPHSAY